MQPVNQSQLYFFLNLFREHYIFCIPIYCQSSVFTLFKVLNFLQIIVYKPLNKYIALGALVLKVVEEVGERRQMILILDLFEKIYIYTYHNNFVSISFNFFVLHFLFWYSNNFNVFKTTICASCYIIKTWK